MAVKVWTGSWERHPTGTSMHVDERGHLLVQKRPEGSNTSASRKTIAIYAPERWTQAHVEEAE